MMTWFKQLRNHRKRKNIEWKYNLFCEIVYTRDMIEEHIHSTLSSIILRLVGDYWDKTFKSMT